MVNLAHTSIKKCTLTFIYVSPCFVKDFPRFSQGKTGQFFIKKEATHRDTS